jgi:hypothetical protein
MGLGSSPHLIVGHIFMPSMGGFCDASSRRILESQHEGAGPQRVLVGNLSRYPGSLMFSRSSERGRAALYDMPALERSSAKLPPLASQCEPLYR